LPQRRQLHQRRIYFNSEFQNTTILLPPVLEWYSQAKKLLAKKKAAAAKKAASSSASANLAVREAKERAAKKTKVKDKKNYNQVRLFWVEWLDTKASCVGVVVLNYRVRFSLGQNKHSRGWVCCLVCETPKYIELYASLCWHCIHSRVFATQCCFKWLKYIAEQTIVMLMSFPTHCLGMRSVTWDAGTHTVRCTPEGAVRAKRRAAVYQ